MAEALKGAVKSMVRMNKQLKLPQLQAIMKDFAIESERMEMTEEIMSDTIDDVMEGDEEVGGCVFVVPGHVWLDPGPRRSRG